VSDARPVVVVGGSVAGAVCALQLAQSGVPSIVLDQHGGAVDKVCGEGLQPVGRELLGGLLPDLDELGRTFDGFEFRFPGLPPLGWSFPGSIRGLGIDRKRLGEALRAALAARPEIDFRPGVALRSLERSTSPAEGWRLELGASELHARIVIGADGVRSGVRTGAGLADGARRGRWGLRCRYRAAPPDRVRIHFGAGVEIYLTPLADGLTSVAILGSEERLRSLDASAVDALLGESGIRPEGPCVSPPQLLPHIGPSVSGPAAHGVFLCGDAALVLDPISGAGMTLAAITGALAAESATTIVRGESLRSATARFVRTSGRATRPYRALTSFLLLLARSERARWCAERLFRRHPDWLAWCARPTFRALALSTSDA